jgi:hypothetical protein
MGLDEALALSECAAAHRSGVEITGGFFVTSTQN